MKDEDIDDVLKRLGDAQPAVDPTLLDSISASLRSDLQPATPIAAPWRLTGRLILFACAVATAIALLLGPHGAAKMQLGQGAGMVAVLGISMLLSAGLLAEQAVPGSRRLLPPWMLTLLSSIALCAAFAVLFHEDRTAGFVVAGVKCLVAGTVAAIPVGILSGRVLRQGYFVNRMEAGLAGGTLAGLAGVAMLEIHCPNFEALHLVVWHTGVVLLSTVLGMFAGSISRNGRG